jgi:hypothetical protein
MWVGDDASDRGEGQMGVHTLLNRCKTRTPQIERPTMPHGGTARAGPMCATHHHRRPDCFSSARGGAVLSFDSLAYRWPTQQR